MSRGLNYNEKLLFCFNYLSPFLGRGELRRGLLLTGESIKGLGYHLYLDGDCVDNLESLPSLMSDAGNMTFLCLSINVPGEMFSSNRRAGYYLGFIKGLSKFFPIS